MKKVAAGPEGLCVLAVCDINLRHLVHSAGCQLAEGPDYLLPVIILSLIYPVMQNVQYQFVLLSPGLLFFSFFDLFLSKFIQNLKGFEASAVADTNRTAANVLGAFCATMEMKTL